MRIPQDVVGRLLKEAEDLKMEACHADALVILEQILAANPDNVMALEEVADNELSLEQYDRAERAARHAVALDPKSFDAHYIIGFIESFREHWQLSIDSLRKANALEPNNPEILRCLGWSLFSGGQVLPGTVTLERALNLEATNPLILCDLGVVYLKMKEYPKAKALLERALEIDPANLRVKECLDMAVRIEDHMKGGRKSIA